MEKQKNIPELRFPVFDGEYNKKPLGKIAQINTSTNSLPESFTYIDLESVVKGQLVKKSVIKKSEAPSRAQRFLEPNDILFQMVRPYQQNNLFFDLTGDYVASTGYAQIKTKEDSRFLYQYLHTRKFVNKVIDKCTGTSYPAINSKDLARIYVCFPTLPEQQKIASFFTAIDQKISHLKQKHELLEQYKKGVMQKIFSQEIRFRDDNGREFPKWEKKRLGELSVKVNDRNNNGKVTEVFTNSAFSGIVNQRDYFDKDIANQDNLFNYIIVEKDDFIYNPRISNYAPVGPIKRNKIGKGVMSPLYSVFRIRDGNLIFLEFFFETTKWHQYMESIANYGARADRMNLTTSDFYLMPVPFPCLEEQTKIANFLSAINDKIQHTQKQIEQTEQWKKGLMQRMFV